MPRSACDLARIYAFCRTTDDLGDESSDGSALARLERWRGGSSRRSLRGKPPVHPVLFALQQTIARRAMPAQPFLDLIEANVQDQRVKRYRTWDELIGYCTPLGCAGRADGAARLRRERRACERLSDDVCIGLQLANHAQDVSRDAAIGRRYLVENDVEARGIAGAAQAMVERARALARIGTGARARASRERCGCSLRSTGWEGWPSAMPSAQSGIRPSMSDRAFRRARRYRLVVRAALHSLFARTALLR